MFEKEEKKVKRKEKDTREERVKERRKGVWRGLHVPRICHQACCVAPGSYLAAIKRWQGVWYSART